MVSGFVFDVELSSLTCIFSEPQLVDVASRGHMATGFGFIGNIWPQALASTSIYLREHVSVQNLNSSK